MTEILLEGIRFLIVNALTRCKPITHIHQPVGVPSTKGSGAAYIGVTVDRQLCACTRRLGWRSLAGFRFLGFRFEDFGVAVVVARLTALNLRKNSKYRYMKTRAESKCLLGSIFKKY